MNQNETKSNLLLGIVGALLGTLAGAIVYYIVTKIGYIAVISSVAGVGISLALFRKFNRKLTWLGVLICIVLNVVTIILVDTYIFADMILRDPNGAGSGYTLVELMRLVLIGLFRGKFLSDYIYSFLSCGIAIFVGVLLGASQIREQRKAAKLAAEAPIEAEDAVVESAEESVEHNYVEREEYRNDRYDDSMENSNRSDSLDTNLGSLDDPSDKSTF